MIRSLVLFACLAAAGCGDTIINPPTYPAPVPTPTPTVPTPPPAPKLHTVDYRVVGSASSARIRYSNPVDGLTQVVTTLPFDVQFNTTQTVIFLSLDVTPIAFPLLQPSPFMAAQIVVDGSLFREATSADTTLTTLTVSGTWRGN